MQKGAVILVIQVTVSDHNSGSEALCRESCLTASLLWLL